MDDQAIGAAPSPEDKENVAPDTEEQQENPQDESSDDEPTTATGDGQDSAPAEKVSPEDAGEGRGEGNQG